MKEIRSWRENDCFGLGNQSLHAKGGTGQDWNAATGFSTTPHGHSFAVTGGHAFADASELVNNNASGIASNCVIELIVLAHPRRK